MKEQDSPFGEKSWLDVRNAVLRRARAHYGPRGEHAQRIEDAVDEAIVWLFDRWRGRNPQDDGDKRKAFNGAVYYAYLTTRNVLKREQKREEIEIPASDWTDEDGDPFLHQLEDPSPGPEDYAVDLDLYDRANRLLGDLTYEEYDELHADVLGTFGEDQRSYARRLGIHQTTVSRRFARAVPALREHAAKYGLDA